MVFLQIRESNSPIARSGLRMPERPVRYLLRALVQRCQQPIVSLVSILQRSGESEGCDRDSCLAFLPWPGPAGLSGLCWYYLG